MRIGIYGKKAERADGHNTGAATSPSAGSFHKRWAYPVTLRGTGLGLACDIVAVRVADMTPQVSFSDATFRAIFESAVQGIVAVDRSGRIELANACAERQFGYLPGTLTGKPIEALLPERLRRIHQQHREDYSAAPRTRAMGAGQELTGLRRDGSEFPVEVSLSYAGDVSLAIAFITDISERKRLERERDSFFKLSPDLLCILTPDGLFQQVNPAFEKCLGFRAEELAGKPFADLVHPEDRSGAAAVARDWWAGKQTAHYRNRCIAQDGSVRWLEWTARVVRDEGESLYAAARDVTSTVLLEREQQQLAALIEHSPDFVCLATPDGSRILYVNQAGRNLLGLPALEQLRKMSVFELPACSAREEVLEAISLRGYWHGELEFSHMTTGETIPLDAHAFLVTDPAAGQPIAWGYVARDIRERRRDQERLRALTAQLLRAQEDERRRIARELHDGPTQDLALLAAELGLLKKKAGAAEQQALAALHERVLAISEDVRLLAHEFHPGVLEHSGLVAALETYCQEVARHAGIPIRFEARDVVDVPKTVEVSLYRIAQEALHNVTKHSNATMATVTLARVETSPGKRALRLTVIDDGKGFLIEHVRNGSGLGLISIEERVRLIQGVLRIGSVPGEGTRVEVEVPIGEA